MGICGQAYEEDVPSSASRGILEAWRCSGPVRRCCDLCERLGRLSLFGTC